MGQTSYNFFTENRWIANIPTRTIDEDAENDIAFNLIDFSMPSLGLSSTKMSQMGYSYEYPTNVREYEKVLTFHYVIESDFEQYKFLYKWYTKIASEDGAGVAPGVTGRKMMDEIAVPIRVMLLSEYDNVAVEFKFNGCWLTDLDGFTLTYDGEAQIIRGSFSIHFDNFELIK